MGTNNTQCYIISTKHTRPSDPYITLWRPNDRGYCWFNSMAGIYTEIADGYHDSENNFPVRTSIADQLFTKVTYEGREQLAILNTDRNMLILKNNKL